jgi:hypothetical protein
MEKLVIKTISEYIALFHTDIGKELTVIYNLVKETVPGS